ncbi:hypothetical protein KAI87_12595, partial [Myxococcota bacterium]|nr:hypothetical protein [Myxococcota bacterium]
MQHRRSSLILAGALPILFLASACSDSPSTSTTPENEKSALGTACAEADECNSGFCGPVLESDTTVCAECVEDEDCTEADASCEWNSTGEYFSCEAADFPGLSDSCTSGDDCDSGFCYETAADSFCSLCEVAGDCGVQRDCVFYARDSYAVCEGTGILGATCESSDQCISDACAAEVCSECATSEDCGEGGSCVEDTDLGYHVCEGGLGNSCETAEECDSGVCYDTGDGSVCSECEIASVCGVLRDCAYDSSLGYAACVGTAELGDNCDNADQCVSLFCTDGNCAECGTSEDCDGTSCIDDPNGGGYSVCTGAIADPCTISEECDSGFCFERNPSQIRCSECESIGDCSTQQDCLWVRGDGYADCLGTGDLGASCVAGDQCVSAFCNSDICSECDVNE